MFQRISVFSILSVFFTFCFSSFCLHAFSVAYLSFFVVEGMGWGYSGKRFSLVGGETASFSPTLAAIGITLEGRVNRCLWNKRFHGGGAIGHPPTLAAMSSQGIRKAEED